MTSWKKRFEQVVRTIEIISAVAGLPVGFFLLTTKSTVALVLLAFIVGVLVIGGGILLTAEYRRGSEARRLGYTVKECSFRFMADDVTAQHRQEATFEMGAAPWEGRPTEPFGLLRPLELVRTLL